MHALSIVVSAKDDAIREAVDDLASAEHLTTKAESRISDYRAYLLNGNQTFLDLTTRDREEFLALIVKLRGTLTSPSALTILEAVSAAEAKHAAALLPVIEQRKKITDLKEISQLNAVEVGPARKTLQDSITALTTRVRADVETARRESSARATQAIVLIIVLGLLAMGCGGYIAWRLNRDLRREVGAAVGHIQSSSAQLEAIYRDLPWYIREEVKSALYVRVFADALIAHVHKLRPRLTGESTS